MDCQDNYLLSAALAYANGGVFAFPVSVFPVSASGKRPLTRNGFHDATMDETMIRAWWRRNPDANVGLPLAPNGLCAIDIDGDLGMASWAALGPERATPITSTVATPSGGRHLIYVVPDGFSPLGTCGILPGVDLRGPGYLVAAPSIGRTGVYEWAIGPDEIGPAVAPEWILAPDGFSGRARRAVVRAAEAVVSEISPFAGYSPDELLRAVVLSDQDVILTTLYEAARLMLDLVEHARADRMDIDALDLAARFRGVSLDERESVFECARLAHEGNRA